RLEADASKDANQQAALTELRKAKQQLMQLALATPADFSDDAVRKRDALKAQLSEQVEQLEAKLARNVTGLGRARRALSITVPQVQAALADSEVLIELLRCDHYLGKNKWEPRYGALTITSTGEPKWLALGDASV